MQKLQIASGTDELSIQAIESKPDGAFVVKVNAPFGADKAEIERFFREKYDLALQEQAQKYRKELDAKDQDIQAYRQQNTNLTDAIKLLAANAGRVINQYGRGDNVAEDKVSRDKFIES